MEFTFDLSGNNTPVIKEYDIDKDTVIACGEVVGLLDGKVVSDNATINILGISAEEHTGEKDILNPRNDGTKIRVAISPDGVYRVPAPTYEASGGTSSTIVTTSKGLSVGVNSGMVILVKKGVHSENTDKIGSVRKISSCVVSGATATITIDEGAVTYAGDVYAVIPYAGTMLYSDETGTGVCLYRQQAGAEFIAVFADEDNRELYIKLYNSIFA